ncbi:hemerythrin domain-containing protein [Sorangium sp. So ce1153]|uniref:hemerythrin domain-containing protein n=1 Tax=Sorangium sp. So ce1153 TaxID=3133333 RepID=UPI003F5E2ACC
MKGLYDALHRDHQRLDEVFETLLNRVHAGDEEAARETWGTFERELLAHMEAEESLLLPLFDRFNPEEAGTIRAEHLGIRAQLAEMGTALELHTLREAKVDNLIRALRQHAAHEEAELYPWADRELPKPAADRLYERLAAVVDAVKRSAHRSSTTRPGPQAP